MEDGAHTCMLLLLERRFLFSSSTPVQARSRKIPLLLRDEGAPKKIHGRAMARGRYFQVCSRPARQTWRCFLLPPSDENRRTALMSWSAAAEEQARARGARGSSSRSRRHAQASGAMVTRKRRRRRARYRWRPRQAAARQGSGATGDGAGARARARHSPGFGDARPYTPAQLALYGHAARCGARAQQCWPALLTGSAASRRARIMKWHGADDAHVGARATCRRRH